jgi:hypothetical protein
MSNLTHGYAHRPALASHAVVFPNHVYILLGAPATGKSYWAERHNYTEVYDALSEHTRTHLLTSGQVEFAYTGASACKTVSDALLRAGMDLAPLHPLRATVLQFSALGHAPVELLSAEALPVAGQDLEQRAAAAEHAWRLRAA